MKNDGTTLFAGRQHVNSENNRERLQTVSFSGYAEGLGVLAEKKWHRKPLVIRSLRPEGKVTRSKNRDSFPVDKAASKSRISLVKFDLGARQCQQALRICAPTIIQAIALVSFHITRNC